MKKEIKEKAEIYLEERIRHLEGVERFVLDSLELATSLGDFQSSINKLHDVSTILGKTGDKVKTLIPFEAVAFFLVDERSNEFALSYIDSESRRQEVQSEVDNSIDTDLFAWALRERRPVIVPSRDHKAKLVLHSMATASRIRGMFVGLMGKDGPGIQNISLSLLSFILFNSANAIESFELYRRIREINGSLGRIDNYRLLFEAAPDGVEVLDAGGVIIETNEAQNRLLGYRREQLTGRLSTNFFSEESRSLWPKSDKYMTGKGYREGEVELVASSGAKLPVLRKEKAIYDADNNNIGAVVYNHDLTNSKRAESERQALLERLQRAEKMEALGQLAGGVAHDLNNVLGIMSGYSELIIDEIPKGDKSRDHAEKILQSTKKAAAIIDDLLTLARRGVMSSEVISLNMIVSDFLTTPTFDNIKNYHPRVTFRTELEDNILNIKGSSIHLEKTLMNLVGNAAEAISGTGVVNIRTESRYLDRAIHGYDEIREGDYTVLTVSDTGSGISVEEREKIFEPFYTKKKMGRSGTGLGLAIVWGTVKDHNGYIDVQSDIGKGTTFTLYFPVTCEELIAQQQTVSVDQYMGRGESVLVVDDIEEQREIASRLLNKLGYKVSLASSGEDAVEYLKANMADILVLDMIMEPGIDGLDAYRKILEINPKQKAIIVSGFSETDRAREARKLGAGAYVKKPYVMERIGVAIRDELNR